MAQVLGRATIRIDDQVYETERGATLDTGGLKANTINTGSRVEYAEEVMNSSLQCQVNLAEGMSLEPLRQKAGPFNVSFQADTGQQYEVAGAHRTDTLTITEGEGGKIPLNFAGPPAEELL